MKVHLIWTCLLASMIKDIVCYTILPNGYANQQPKNDKNKEQIYKYDNLNSSINNKVLGNSRKSQATKNDGYGSGIVLDEITLKLRMNKFQNEISNKSDSMKETGDTIQKKDKDLHKKDNEEIDVAEIKDIVEVMTDICGEQYKLCKQASFDLNFFKRSSICPMCSCNIKTCHITKNCCPDVSVNINDGQDSLTSNEVCMKLFDVLSLKDQNEQFINDNEMNGTMINQDNNNDILHTEKLKQNDHHFKENNHKNMSNLVKTTTTKLATSSFPKYFVISSCPKDFNDTSTIAKCEDTKSPYLFDNVPVSDWNTINIYRNKWCAKCHNTADTGNWRLITDCLQLFNMRYLPSQTSEFYKLTKNCTVRVIPVSKQKSDNKICGTSNLKQDTSIIDKCNETGLWKPSDSNKTTTIIQKMCEQRNYMPIFHDLMISQKDVYKNIFCYICNSDPDIQAMKNKIDEGKYNLFSLF